MRVKSLAAAVGLSIISAVVLGQGISSASRGPSPDPLIETPAEPVDETPAPPAEETPAAPEVEETPAPPVVDEPPAAPVTTTTTLPPVPAEPPTVQEPAVPVTDVEAPPIVTLEKKAPTPAKAKADPAPKQADPADPCHMDSYERVAVGSLSGGEAARANKVDRNGNGWVCRKDIPGKGRGNTKQNSNIKDDQVR